MAKALVWLALLVAGCGDGLAIVDRPVLEVLDDDRPVADGDAVSIAGTSTLTVRNTGERDLVIDGIAISDGEFTLTSTPNPSGAAPLTLAPGDTHALAVTHVGVDATARSTITIHSNPTATGATRFVFDVVPAAEVAALVAVPAVIDFGAVEAGTTVTQEVTLLATGSVDVLVTRLALSGRDGYSATLAGRTYAAQSDTITLDEPLLVMAGATSTFTVSYVASDATSAIGMLAVSSDTVSAAVALRANVSGPCIAVTPARLDFGGKLVGQLTTLDLRVTSCGDLPLVLGDTTLIDDDHGVFALVAGPTQTTLAPNESTTVTVSYLPEEVARVRDGVALRDVGSLRIGSNAYVADTFVDLTGFGGDGQCPTAVLQCDEPSDVAPQTRLHCTGSASHAANGARIATYAWSVRQPHGATEGFRPNPGAADVTFDVNVVGEYVLTLDVYDELGVRSCQAAERVVQVVADEALRVEVTWSTPGDPDELDTGEYETTGASVGSDLDLHVLDQTGASWFDEPADCYWHNDAPAWGGAAIDDDPRIARDDTDGAGPEVFVLDAPALDHTYTVAVHGWDDWGFGDSVATVRVYVYGVLRFTSEPVTVARKDLWEVCDIDWPSGTITPIGLEPEITADYPVPFGF